MKKIYFDHAATTPIADEVLEAMLPYFQTDFGNPSSRHSFGVQARKGVDKARVKIAEILNCKPREIVFTSGGTESNNLAIFGHINSIGNCEALSSNIEHPSVFHCYEHLKKTGKIDFKYLKVDQEGLLSPSALEEGISDNSKIFSLIYANNEIGVIQDIASFGAICQEKGIKFHMDACQAAGNCLLDVQKLKVDLMTLNAGKIYGPKGSGLLYIKEGTPITPLIHGGDQEQGLRSGTLNVPGIIGLAKALEIAESQKEKEVERLTKLRDQAIRELRQNIPGVAINGHPTKRLANNINLKIPGIEASNFTLLLDQLGLAISTGSACSSGSDSPSPTLLALGLSEEESASCLRISLGRSTKTEDVERLTKTITELQQRLTK